MSTAESKNTKAVHTSPAASANTHSSSGLSKPAVHSLQKTSISKPANTGLPDNLRSGIERLSGFSMDDVEVHYNSPKPLQLQAFAFAQGTDIHVAPGQERHLPHEAWHVVQQKQGRVQPSVQLKGDNMVNDDAGLENEADTMGRLAIHTAFRPDTAPLQRVAVSSARVKQLAAPGSIAHIRSSCYIAAILNSIVVSNGLKNLINPAANPLPAQGYQALSHLQDVLYQAVDTVNLTNPLSAEWVMGIMTAMAGVGIIQDMGSQDVNEVMSKLMHALTDPRGPQAAVHYAGVIGWDANIPLANAITAALPVPSVVIAYDPVNPADTIQVQRQPGNMAPAPPTMQLPVLGQPSATYHLRSAVNRDTTTYNESHFISYINRASINTQPEEWHESDDVGPRVRPLPLGPDNVQTDPGLIADKKQRIKVKYKLEDEDLEDPRWQEQLAPRPIDVRGGAVMYIYERQDAAALAGPLQMPAVDTTPFRNNYIRALFLQRGNASVRHKRSLLQMMETDDGKEAFKDEIATLQQETQNAGGDELSKMLALASMEPIMHGAHVNHLRVGFEGAATILGILLNGQIIPMQVQGEGEGPLESNRTAKPGTPPDKEISEQIAKYQLLAVAADETKKNHRQGYEKENETLAIPYTKAFIKKQLEELDEVKQARGNTPRKLFEQILLANKGNKSRPDALPESGNESLENKKLRRHKTLMDHHLSGESDIPEFDALHAVNKKDDNTYGHSEQLLLSMELWAAIVQQLFTAFSDGAKKDELQRNIPVQDLSLLLNRSPCVECAQYLTLELIDFWINLAEHMGLQLPWQDAMEIFGDYFNFRIVYTSVFEPATFPQVTGALTQAGWTLVAVEAMSNTDRGKGVDMGSIKITPLGKKDLKKISKQQQKQDAKDEYKPDDEEYDSEDEEKMSKKRGRLATVSKPRKDAAKKQKRGSGRRK
jgi:hypothetical protein